jgi:hypothetical protein
MEQRGWLRQGGLGTQSGSEGGKLKSEKQKTALEPRGGKREEAKDGKTE